MFYINDNIRATLKQLKDAVGEIARGIELINGRSTTAAVLRDLEDVRASLVETTRAVEALMRDCRP